MHTKNKILFAVLILIIVTLAITIIAKPKNAIAPIAQKEINNEIVKDTYTYINHGFSIELPKGFIPVETQGEGGPGLHISLPGDLLVYYGDNKFWKNSILPSYKYIKDEKIGETVFKIYDYDDEHVVYWYERGNVGYELHGNKNSFVTFKFVGWPQIEGNKEDLVSFSIKPGQEVSGKMKVTGTIKGGYFFEGNLPMIILDVNKNITMYGPGHATATTDWMTAGPVSFETEVDFSIIPKGDAYIKIIQDDPSGGESGLIVRSIIIPIIIK